MKSYIFTERNGIHIIDLQRTITLLKSAYNAVKELAKSNGTILFVGTKRQAQSAIVEEASRCGMPYVANRWLGGMLTNFSTIQKSIQRLKKLERMEVDGSFEFMTKKEVIRLTREKEKLLKNIGGIKDLETLPDMIFIIDPKKEAIAVAEAMRLKVPIVAIIDTNCNPEGIDHPIPGNDDAIRAINLFSAIISSAVVEGQNEAGKIEVTEDTQIVSLEEEEQARAARERAEEVGDYLSDEELEGTGEKLAPSAETAVEDETVRDEVPVGSSEEKTAQESVEEAAPGSSAAGTQETEEQETAEAATPAEPATPVKTAESATPTTLEASAETDEEPSEKDAPIKKQESAPADAAEQEVTDTENSANETAESGAADTETPEQGNEETEEADNASDEKQGQ
jgi:small subunit ribosomal protein S2